MLSSISDEQRQEARQVNEMSMWGDATFRKGADADAWQGKRCVFLM